MTTRKLFVSHSSKTVENTDLLREICANLQTNDNGWYVLVDRGGDIYPTLDWEQRLDEWLAECHAAVILVSEAALESWWVQKEATILKWRWRLDPNFRHLFLVLLNGLSPDVFDRPSYRILNLKQIQCLTNHGDDANEIINTIENVLPRDDPATTPFDDLQAVIRDLLSSRTTDTLRRACDAIQLEAKLGEQIRWTGSEDAPYATAVARLMLRNHATSLKVFMEVLQSIHPPLPQAEAEELYKYISPLWVSKEAAALLPLLRDASGFTEGALAMNGRRLYEFTAMLHIQRAHALDDLWEFVTVDRKYDEAHHAIECIRNHFRTYNIIDRDASPKKADQEIRSFGAPIYVLLPAKLTDPYMIAELRKHYKNIIYLLDSGEIVPQEIELPNHVIPLSPAVDLADEERQNQWIKQARSLIRGRGRRSTL